MSDQHELSVEETAGEVPHVDDATAGLHLSRELYEVMIDHLRSTLPLEGCGIIACKSGVAVKVFPGTNTESSETRYNMDLTEIVEAFDEIDRCGWQLGALFHSHPRSTPVPSETDLTHAYYPDALMVIVSFASEPPEARAFRVDGEVREVPIEIT
jgi:proteasome lid subunit RPN8/RPN11